MRRQVPRFTHMLSHFKQKRRMGGGGGSKNRAHGSTRVSQHKCGDVTQSPALISTEEDTEATRVQPAGRRHRQGSSAPPNQPQNHRPPVDRFSEGRSRPAQTQTQKPPSAMGRSQLCATNTLVSLHAYISGSRPFPSQGPGAGLSGHCPGP